MILFFDRNVGTRIPMALQRLRLPVGIEYHQRHFKSNALDDAWLPVVGRQGWIVISQDYKFHALPNELYALREYDIGCFYLWGAQAGTWEVTRLFARAFDRIVERAENTPRPFVYWITKDGRLQPQRLP